DGVLRNLHLHLAHIGHAGCTHGHVFRADFPDFLRDGFLIDADKSRDIMSHGIHRVVRLVAMDRPVSKVFRVELVGTHRAYGDVDADLWPAGFGADPAAIGTGDLE